MDVAFITEQFHGSSPQLVVFGHPYFGSDGTAPRVEKEVLGPGDAMRHGPWYWWNRKVDEVLSPNRGGMILIRSLAVKHTQIVGRCAAYTSWH